MKQELEWRDCKILVFGFKPGLDINLDSLRVEKNSTFFFYGTKNIIVETRCKINCTSDKFYAPYIFARISV